jgi:hypothetical protein
MSSLLPVIAFQQTDATSSTTRSSKASLQAHFPESPAYAVLDAEYRKKALKVLLSDSDELTGDSSPTDKSYWVGSSYRRKYGSNGSPSYSDVALVAADGDGKPESPYFPNRASGVDADPKKIPQVTSQPDPAVVNDLALVSAAGSEGSVKSRNPKTYSDRSEVADSEFTADGRLTLTSGNSRITMKGTAPKFGS